MTKNHKIQAKEYYKLIGEKNVEGMKKYLDHKVQFFSPLANLEGKDAVIESTSNFMNAISSLKIRAAFESGNQAIVVYDVDFPGIVDNFPGASLLTFHNDLIVKIELFHDASRFTKEF